jgi:hypothetical protein
MNHLVRRNPAKTEAVTERSVCGRVPGPRTGVSREVLIVRSGETAPA